MAFTICFYEDGKYRNFFPLTQLRPVYTLRAGIVPLFLRARRYFPDSEITLSCRDQLSGRLAGDWRDFPVNIIKRQDESGLLMLNGRIRDYGNLPQLVEQARISTIFETDGETVAIYLTPDWAQAVPRVATTTEYGNRLKTANSSVTGANTTATVYSFCWEVMADIEAEIAADFRFLVPGLPGGQNIKIHDGVDWVNQDDIYLNSDVEIFPQAVIDASTGPVYIDRNTKVESHAVIQGPTYIGANSVVVAGKIASSSIGHTCRVGGEVEHSVFQSYVNKYHAGFIGHSYVGSWVNFGAMTTNSDLKNNYSDIRVSLNSEQIDTGSNKIGSFIGDHTKFGIGTLLNTGINIGVGCNLFGGTLISDREVPPFSWGTTGNYSRYEYDKAIETVQKVAQRRNCDLSHGEIALLQAIYRQETTDDGVLAF